MSIRVMSQVWDSGPEQQGELLVLLALADFADDAGRCWPSIRAIAKKARVTERGAQKIIRRLEASGYVRTVVGGGRNGCNQYVVTPNVVHPEHGSPPNVETQNPEPPFTPPPNGGSPEPSLNRQEPSESIPRKPSKRKTRLREDAEITDGMRRAAEKRGHSQQEAEAQFQKFKNDALAKGKTFVEWDRAFVTWLDSPYFRPITTSNTKDGSAAARAQRIGERYAAKLSRDMDSGPDRNSVVPLLPARNTR